MKASSGIVVHGEHRHHKRGQGPIGDGSHPPIDAARVCPDLRSKDTTKMAWDSLRIMRVGYDRMRKAKAQQLWQEY